MRKKGVVTGLIRHLNVLTAVLDSGQPISAAPLNFWPPPRSTCWFEETGPGSWLCLGTVGDRRVVLHDDFFLSYRDAATFLIFGDTTWFTVGTLGTFAQSGASGFGKMLLTTANSNYLAITKSENAVALEATAGIWFSAKFMVTTDLTNVNVAIGLIDSGWADQGALVAGDAALALQYNTGLGASTLFARAINGTASTTAAVGNAIQVDTYITVDIVACANFACFWMDGEGPTTITTNIPTGTAFQPTFSVLSTVAAPRSAAIDWVHVEYFSAMTQP